MHVYSIRYCHYIYSNTACTNICIVRVYRQCVCVGYYCTIFIVLFIVCRYSLTVSSSCHVTLQLTTSKNDACFKLEVHV